MGPSFPHSLLRTRGVSSYFVVVPRGRGGGGGGDR